MPGEENQSHQKDYLQQLNGYPLKSVLIEVEKDFIIQALKKNRRTTGNWQDRIL